LTKGKNCFIGSGHLTPGEMAVLVKRGRGLGCRMVANSVSTDMPGYPVEAQKQWAAQGVFIEHDYMAVTDVPHVKMPIETVVAQIRAVGAERCVLGTDAGNMRLPDNVESLRDYVGRLLAAGLSEKEIDLMTRVNPKVVLGIS